MTHLFEVKSPYPYGKSSRGIPWREPSFEGSGFPIFSFRINDLGAKGTGNRKGRGVRRTLGIITQGF